MTASSPSTACFTVQQIAQVVPTADGQQLWVTQFGSGSYGYSGYSGYPNAAMPDGNGGILINLLTNPGSSPQTFQIADLDAQTGTQIWAYNSGSDFRSLTQQAAIRGDGVIFRQGGFQGQYALIGIDPNTGSIVSAYTVPAGSATFTYCSTTSGTLPMHNSVLSPPTVGSDGTVYSVVTKTDVVVAGCPAYTNYPFQALSSLTQTLFLLQIAQDGSSSLTQLRQDSPHSSPSDAGTYISSDVGVYAFYQQLDLPAAAAYHVIPDGQGGTLVPYQFVWTAQYYSIPPSWPQHVTHVASGGAVNDFVLSLQPTPNPQEFPMVLGETGAAYSTDGQTIQAFDGNSGQSLWSYTSP